jgi:preprotein translocase subunit Sec63
VCALITTINNADIGYVSPSAVLGVPHYASAEEIRERYRALSLIFHPDKQHHGISEEARQVAQKRHLEVQKAYEGAHTGRLPFMNCILTPRSSVGSIPQVC